MVYRKNDIFFLYKKCLRFMGMWPLDSPTIVASISFWTITFLQIGLLILRLINPFGKCPAYEFGSTDFTLTVYRICSITLQFGFRLSRNQKVSLIKSMENDWSSVTDSAEREIMTRHYKCGHLLFVFYIIIFGFTMVIQFFKLPSIGILEHRDIRTTCAFVDDSPWITINATLSLVTSAMTYSLYWSTKALFWNFFMHLSAQYKILKMRYHDLQLIADDKERRKVFRRLVQRHNDLFTLCRALKTSFNDYSTFSVSFDQFYVCMFVVSLTADIQALRFRRASSSLMLLAITLLSLVVSYYAGDYLTGCCKDVGEALTQCNWYDLSKEFIINYSIVILRCQIPAQFTAMKICKLNLYHFKYVLDALYSYISLMIAFAKDEP